MSTLMGMVDDTVDSTLDNDVWLTLAEAAPVLGVSEKTVRRRAKAGQIEGRQVSTQHGMAWQVRVPGRVDSVVTVDSLGTQPSTQVSTPTQSADVAALVALADRLEREKTELVDENRELVKTVAAWQSQALVLAGWLTEARDQLALTAPATPQQPQAVSGAPSPPAPTTDGPVPSSARLRALAPWLLAALAIVAVVALLAWSR
jgi:hypothetical protein